MVLAKNVHVKKKLGDLLLEVSWAKIADRYFKRSPTWIYDKIDGVDANGSEGGFSPDELEQLKGALTDLADRIRRAADSL